MQPQAPCFIARRKFQTRSKIKQDIGHLRDHKLPCLQKWRSEWRVFVPPITHYGHHTIHTPGFTRHIIVGGAGILQCEPYELTTTLNLRPVKELVTHRITVKKNSGA
jgi:hypothetical protein